MRLSQILTLIEARRNPAQNPKVNVRQNIQTLVDTAVENKDYIAGYPNLFVSITSINKLGINPNTEYGTPMGIYIWMGQYVNWGWGTGAGDDFGKAKYVNAFKIQGNIVNLQMVSSKDVTELEDKLVKIIISKSNYTDKSIRQYLHDQVDDMVDEPTAGQTFYLLAGVAAKLLYKTRPAQGWAHLFRQCGVDGLLDDDGIIYESSTELTQGVIFSVNNIVKGSVETFNIPDKGFDEFEDDDVLPTYDKPNNSTQEPKIDAKTLTPGDVVQMIDPGDPWNKKISNARFIRNAGTPGDPRYVFTTELSPSGVGLPDPIIFRKVSNAPEGWLDPDSMEYKIKNLLKPGCRLFTVKNGRNVYSVMIGKGSKPNTIVVKDDTTKENHEINISDIKNILQ